MMTEGKAPGTPDDIEDNAEIVDDKDAAPEEAVAIELPVEPDDPNGQPV